MNQRTLAARLALQAREACGYRALPNRGSLYGSVVSYPNQPWGGAFVTVTAMEAGVEIYPCTDAVAALAYYSKSNRVYRKPQEGGLVFFAFSGNGQFGQPAVGIVTDVSEYRELGRFRAVLGEVASGLPRASDTPNGVFEISFYAADVLAFVRPRYRQIETEPEKFTAKATVRLSRLGKSKRNADIVTVQQALLETVGLTGAERGRFDKSTVSSYCAWQRMCGRVGEDANGVPDLESLRLLGQRSKLFTVKD